MSIYTITLKRELLNCKGRQADCGQANWLNEQSIEEHPTTSAEAKRLVSGRGEGQVYGYNRSSSCLGEASEAINARSFDEEDGTKEIYDSPAGAEATDASLSQANWLDCLCGAKQRLEQRQKQEEGRKKDKNTTNNNNKEQAKTPNNQLDFKDQQENLCGHSRECIEFRRDLLLKFKREKSLQEQANQIEHSVNVTLEVTANLKQPNRIVWYKNDRQLTSSEKPILFVSRPRRPTTTNKRLQDSGTTTNYLRSSSSKKRSISGAQGQLIAEEEEIYEESRSIDELSSIGGNLEGDLIKKCVQESNERGSKLTIHDIQDEDYGQYTCKLIGVDGNQVDIRAQLKQDKSLSSNNNHNIRRKRKHQLSTMDEVIEVKEGDLNIEMGIQILPETNDNEELMTEEEKAEFIENTTITWFKDDVKLNEKDPQVNKLFQFTYDQQEGFHRLIVRRATKETEGVYTCLVENESGTSSCSTQLVVGPGNKPKLTSRLQDVTVYVGQSLEFRIKSTGLPPIDSCQWFKDDELIIELANETSSKSTTSTTTSTISKSNERISMSRSEEWSASSIDGDNKVIIFKLCIDNLKLDDTGRYKCRIINEFGYDETDCSVKVLQEIIEEHEEIEETIEETVRLGGGKKSTREEAEETVVTEEQELEEASENERRSVKRQRQEKEELDVEMATREAPRFLRVLEDTETTLGETMVLRVALDHSNETLQADDVRFVKDGKTIYSSKNDGESREWVTSSRSRARVRSYEETIEVEETTTTTATRTTRRYSRQQQQEQRRAKWYEIQVDNVQLDQMGSWECQAENSAGSVSCRADVEVFAEPRIVTDLAEGVRVQPEREIRLTVEASGSPIPVYSWFKDGLGIAEEDNRVFTESKSTTKVTSTTTTRERRRSSLTSSLRTSDDGISVSGETLIIKGARPEDEGLYSCKVENRLGQVKSRECRLTIIGHGDDLNSAPKIIKDFSRDQIFQVDEGESVSLRVLAEGHPKPRQYWFKDTEEIVERISRFEVESEGQEYKLKIKRSSVSDSGRYKVVLRNEFGETESRTVEVLVNKISEETESQRRPSAPTIMVDSQDKVVGLGSNVSFDVQVGGHPKPFVTWYKNGRRMTESGDGRVSFVEEETVTTIIDEEEDTRTGKVTQTTRKETSTTHKLVITNVRESDEAIYSLKAENDLGSTKSSLVSLTIDKRKEATDELSESRSKQQSKSTKETAVVEEEEEATTTVVTQTTTTTEKDDELEDIERRKKKSSNIRSEQFEDEEDEEDASNNNKRRTTTRTTRTTTTTTTTTEEEEAARKRREEEIAKQESEEQEEETSRRSKRRTVVEEEEEEEEEQEERVKRRLKLEEELQEEVEEEEREVVRKKIVQMDVDEEELEEQQQVEEEEVEERKERLRNKKRDSINESTTTKTKKTSTDKETKRRESGARRTEEEEIIEEDEEERIREKRRAPRIVSAPKRVVAGLGSSPEVEIEVETTKVEVEETKVTWLKNDQPIPSRLLRDNHIELLEESTPNSGIKKHRLRINSLRSSDAGTYKLKVENPLGVAETEPIELELDRSMRPGDKPTVTQAEIIPETTGRPEAPQISKIPQEIVAGVGSSPIIEAELKGQPKPDVTWFKDGQPIAPEDLEKGHLEIVDLPTDKPDTVKQALKINNLKPADVAAYHVKAENPLGETESEPTNLRIDRSMGPRDEPIVTDSTPMDVDEQPVLTKPQESGPAPKGRKPVLPIEEKLIEAPVGATMTMTIPVEGGKPKQVEWFKDGKPIKGSPLEDHIKQEEAPDGTQKLQIKGIKPEDEGDYTVKAKNDAGETESAPIKLVVDKKDAPETRRKPEQAPEVLSVTEEVVAGPGSEPELEVVIKANPQADVTWFKDGRPLTDRRLSDGHLEPMEIRSPDSPDVCKYVLKVDKLKASDAGNYHVVATNPLGSTESKPINLKLDRTMRPSETPQVKKSAPVGDEQAPAAPAAPTVVALPEEVVAGIGSNPVIEADIKGSPEPDVTWFKDGQPLTPRQLRDGHLEPVSAPTDVPGVTKHTLKVNDARPMDAGAYHLKADNPEGSVESEPINLRIDRTMGPNDEPTVTGLDKPTEDARDDSPKKRDEPRTDQVAPTIVSAPKEVIAGRGSNPVLEAEVSGKPEPEITWFKDGHPITARQLCDGHLEIVELPTDKPDTVKQGLKINDMKPIDVAAYNIKAENPLGEAESELTKVKLDRSMGPRDVPIVTGLDKIPKQPVDAMPSKRRDSDQTAPTVASIPEEVVAGAGSNPVIEAEIQGEPKPDVTWFKDGQPITPKDLANGHLEIVDLPTDKPDTIKQGLKINNLKPADVAAYHVKAENPLGETESEPTNLRIDRSMGPRDEPIVTGLDESDLPTDVAHKPTKRHEPKKDDQDEVSPSIVSAPKEVVAGRGSSPVLETEVSGKPEPEITWLKDGKPITPRDLADGHLEIVDLPTDKPDTLKQALKINNFKPADVAEYNVKAENPSGEVVSEPTNVRLDRSMGPNDEPIVTKLEKPDQKSSEDTPEKMEHAPTEKGQVAPKIVSVPEEVVAGRGSSPVLEAEVMGKPEPEVVWFKDGQPITQRDLADGHLEIVDLPTDKPDTVKQGLKINNLKPADVAEYNVKAENPLGEAESEPTKVRLDRSMGPNDAPVVTKPDTSAADELPSKRNHLVDEKDQVAPSIVSAPKEIVAGRGSSPVLETEVSGSPVPDVTWFKDGQPIKSEELADGHLEIVDIPTDKPDTIKQGLKINNLKAADVADYNVKAENPLGEAESEPTKVSLDRSMGPRDEPKIIGLDKAEKQPLDTLKSKKPEPTESDADQTAPNVVKIPEEVVAGVGSNPMIEAEIKGEPKPEITWFKDGQPITPKDLANGHMEVVDLPTDQPDTVKQGLKINNLKPADVAAYHVKAENPLGEFESEPTNLRIDCSMGPRDEPIVTDSTPMDVDEQPVLTKPQESGPAPKGRKPVLPIEEKLIEAPVGATMTMTIPVEGGKPKQVEWFKDGKPIKGSPLEDHIKQEEAPDGTQKLQIKGIKPEDEGDYTVKAKNDAGETESAPIKLVVDKKDAPETRRKPEQAPEVLSVTEEVVAGPGSEPELEVVIKANPQADVTWFKDGRPLTDRRLSDGHLEPMEIRSPDSPDVCKYVLKVDKLKASDAGNYHVVATNPLGSTESKPINLKLDRTMRPSETPQVKKSAPVGDEQAPAAPAAPTVVALPEEVVAGIGSNPVIEADIKGSPEPDVTWFKDGQPLTPRQLRDGHLEPVSAPTDVPGVTKHTLKVNDARPMDAGAYHLKADNPEGSVESEPINLRIDRTMGPNDEPTVTGLDKPIEDARDDTRKPAKQVPDRLNQVAPKIVSAPKEIVAGRDSSPVLEAEVSGKPEPDVTWFKDGQPITPKDLANGHLELVDLPTDKPDTIMQGLKFNNLKPSDVAAYHIKAENPLGEAESEPTNVRIDRSMGSRDEPVVIGLDKPDQLSAGDMPQKADGQDYQPPAISTTPKDVTAGRGSSPLLQAEVSGKPAPEVTWFKDGKPITPRDLADGHMEILELPTDKPDTLKQGLKINDLKPTDVAAYHIKAENPLGEAESEPTKVKLDRSMGPSDEPVVTGLDTAAKQTADSPSGKKHQPLANDSDQTAPTVVSMPEEVVAGAGSNPVIEAELKGQPKPDVTWLKDGQPIAPRDLANGHLEIVELPTDQPDTVKQALKINNLKPADVAAYHVKAENPLGETESGPTNLRIDRTMRPRDEPVVTKAQPDSDEVTQVEKPRIAQTPRNITAPLGSSPTLDVEVIGGEPTKVEWLKDGKPVKESPDMHVEIESLPDGTHKLHINNLKPQDEGVYTLRATNDAGVAESGPIKLAVQSGRPKEEPEVVEKAPEIVNRTEEVVAGPGSHPRLEVEVRASPQADVTWYKDGRPIAQRRMSIGHMGVGAEKSPLGPEVTKYVLKVDKIKPNDEGTYNLVAHNPFGSADSGPIQLKVERSLEPDEKPIVKYTQEPVAAGDEFAPQFLSTTDEVVAGVGSSPILAVAIKANPKPNITWFKDGQPLGADDLAKGHLEILDLPSEEPDTVCKQALKINKLRPADVAAYHAKAENPLGEAESEPTNVRIDRSMASTDEPIVTKSERPFSPEEALASKRAPQAPSIRKIPRKIVAALGSNPVIEVEVLGEPKPEVVWYKDGKQVSEMRGHLALIELPNGIGHKLCITNVKAVDQGDYTITATNEAGEVQSAPISLVIDSTMSPKDVPHVVDSSETPMDTKEAEEASMPSGSFAPKIVHTSDRVVASMGDEARIEVEVKALPAADICWYRDGEPLPSRLIEEGHIQVSETPSGEDSTTTKYTLLITGLKPSDAAVYHAELENPLGSAKSPSIQVTLKSPKDDGDDDMTGATQAPQQVDGKPRNLRAPVIKRIPRQVVAGLGSSPVLEVEVMGEPVPKVVWFKNGKRIDTGDAHFTIEANPETGVHRLTVNNLRSSDEATYSVEASNEAGTVESGPIELKVDRTMKARDKPREELATDSVPTTGGSIDDSSGLAPEVVSCTEEVVAGIGSVPELVVVIRANPKAEVTWFKDGLPVGVNKKFEITSVSIDSETTKYVLKIQGLKPIDVGAYHLRAENPYGFIESVPSNVRIDRSMDAEAAPLSTTSGLAPEELEAPTKRKLRAPVIKRMPRRIVAGVGSSPVIEIEVSGEPKPEIIWYKNGRRVTEVRNRISFEEGPDGVFRLCFTNLKATDQAEYTVVASNEAGTVESAPISLVVDKSMSDKAKPFVQDATDLEIPDETNELAGPKEAPKIIGLDDREVHLGGTVKLEAEVTGNPKPQIKWMKDGDEVELNILNEVPDSNKHSLTLKNVNDLYDGVYSLEAINPLGVARKDATVRVVDKLTEVQHKTSEPEIFEPEPVETPRPVRVVEERPQKPFITKGLKFSQVNQGRSIKFEVQIDGKYDELIWMKDGEQINVALLDDAETEVVRETTDHIMESKGDFEDDDDADALITGDDLVSGKPKRRFPPRIIRRPRNVVAGPGSRVAFEVEFEGEPRPEIVWFKDNERITITESLYGKMAIEEVSETCLRLIIEDVQEGDVGQYHLVAENSYGSERTIPVCLELDQDMVASDDLANTNQQHEHPFDDHGDDQRPLKRGRAPRILTRPRPIHAAKGSRVAFEVVVSGEPRPIVNWFRDGRLITQTSDGHVMVEEFSDGCVRLVLDNITDSDVGLYHVVAENKLGSERTIPVGLTLDEQSGRGPCDLAGEMEGAPETDGWPVRRRNGRPPRILLRPKHLQATLGGEASLEVQVVGQSRPSIVWYKDGQRVVTDSRTRIEQITDDYQRLVITNVEQGDAGDYTVSAENDFGVAMSQPIKVSVSKATTETTTTTTTTTTTETFYERFVDDGSGDIEVKEDGKRRAPRFTIRPKNKKAPLGSRVDFEVCVKGTPKPDIVWYKNGRKIHTGPDGRVRVEEFSDGGASKLIIEDLEETDHGVYAAEARNEWGSARTEDVQLRVTHRTEVSERTETSQRGSARVTTKTRKTRSHYTFNEERHGYVTLTINDAQLDHDGDYKLLVRNKWGEASTQAPLVVIPKVEPRGGARASTDRSAYDGESSLDGRDSRARRTPFDELEDYGHELDRSVGIFGSESRYQSGEDTYLLQLRDTEFPLRLRKYLRFGARQSPSLRSNLMDAHWGSGARVTIRERRKFREVMDEEIDDEKRGLDLRPTPMRLQKEVGTCGYAAAQLEHLRVEAAEKRVQRKSAEVHGESGAEVEMMPPFFREKLKDSVIEESASGQQEALFACLAAGEPRPEYTWFRNDIIITPETARMQITSRPEDGGSELRIRDPRLHDSGCFKCVARNVHGNVTSRARLRVASRPSRPEPPEFVSVTSHEVYLEWRPPRDYDTNAAEVLGYRLEMSQSSIGQQDNWSVLAADIGHEYYVVDDLTPATSYSFRISARNKLGWSDSSYSTYVTTCREADAGGRLSVPHEMRSRQFVSDIIDPHLLRHCEEEKRPRLNYQLEQNPIKLNGPSGQEQWFEAYTLQSEIARGRFSIIAKAACKTRQRTLEQGDHDENGLSSQQQVVIKAVLVDSMSAAQTKSEFDILRSLQHEKVVRLEAAYRNDDVFVFVLERLSGLDVLTYLSSFTSYNEDSISRIITQVMDALEYLHFRGMCLLELLPDNVVMTNGRSTALKLVDFSSARFVPRSGARVPINSSQNIEYCPPEVIAGHEVSTASDVWCIGVLTYVLLSGFSPFKGETEEETRENVRLGRYKYDHIYGNCTPEVTRFLINVFKKHSTKRPTIEQLYENKWLLPNEFMIRKRQHATFKTDKIVAFAEEFHKFKSQQQEAPTQKLADILAAASR